MQLDSNNIFKLLIIFLSFIPIAVQAVLPPEHYAKKAHLSKTKAVAVVTDIKTVERSTQNNLIKVFFKTKRSFTDQTRKKFSALCYTLDNDRQKPMPGGTIYYYPHKDAEVLVTADNNFITSYTRLSPMLKNELEKNSLENIYFLMGKAKIKNIQKIKILIKQERFKDALNLIENHLQIEKKKLQRVQKTNIMEYTKLYDEIADLIIMKNTLLTKMERSADINIEQIYNFILDYAEVEFLKTKFYKTPFHEDIAKTLANIVKLYGFVLPAYGKKYLNSIIHIKKNLYGTNSEEYAQSLDNMGNFLNIRLFKLSDAIKYYQKAKTIREKIYTKNDPRVTKNFAQLAMAVYFHRSDKQTALKLLDRSLKIRKSSSGTNYTLLFQALMDYSYFYNITGDYQKSLNYLKKAEKLLLALDKKNSYEMKKVYKQMADIYFNTNNETLETYYLKKAASIKLDQ